MALGGHSGEKRPRARKTGFFNFRTLYSTWKRVKNDMFWASFQVEQGSLAMRSLSQARRSFKLTVLGDYSTNFRSVVMPLS